MTGFSHSPAVRAGFVVLIGLLIGAFGLRLWALGDGSVWHDEGWSIRAIRDPIGTPDDNTPLLYYSLMHLLWQGAGETPLALRYGSALLGVLTVAVGARIARQWAGWDAAILVAVLLGASPLLWAYAREIRAYVMVPLLSLVLLWQTDRLLMPRASFPWRLWAGMLVAETVLLYSHNLSVTVVGWLNLVVGGVWLWERRWRSLGIWLGGQAAVLVLYLPWVFGQSPSGTPLNTPPEISLSLVWGIWQGYFAPLPALIGAKTALELGSATFGVVALAGAAAALTWRGDRRTWLALSQAALLPTLATILLLAANIDFHPRYYVAGVPATMLLVVLGAVSLPDEFELSRAAVPLGIALACAVGAASFPVLLDDPRYQHDDFRALAEHYADLPDDAIIVIPYGWEPALEEYYADKIGVEAEIVGIDLHSDAATAARAINAALAERAGPVRVELLTWYQLPADTRGMYSCLLASAGQQTGHSYTVQGITTQGYVLEHPIEFMTVDNAAITYGLLNLAGAAQSGHESICLRTTWELQQSSGQDWRVAARLLTTHPPGWIIARSDSDIRRDDQAPTSDWNPGQHGAAFSLLEFPAGAPPGDYTLEIGVYSRAEPRGLDRLVDGIPSGRRVTLASVRVDEPTGLVSAPSAGPIALDQNVALAGHNARGGTLSPGQELRITLRWVVTGACCRAQPWTGGMLALRGADWEVAQPVAAYAPYSLDWHGLLVPAGASGPAELTIESAMAAPVTLATYTVEPTDHLLTPPPFDVTVQAVFGEVATLPSVSVDQTVIAPGEPLDLTLVWRVLNTPGVSYKVFTHLLGEDGRVVAQHDGFPVDGERLTTGWVPDEYIVDRHTLTFLPEYAAYRGPARLEVGLYDPATGDRVPVAPGVDYVILPVEIMVQ